MEADAAQEELEREEAVLAALRGTVPNYVVNSEALPLWQERFGGKPLI